MPWGRMELEVFQEVKWGQCLCSLLRERENDIRWGQKLVSAEVCKLQKGVPYLSELYPESRRLEFEILEVLVTMRSREAVVKWRKKPKLHANCEFTQLHHSVLVLYFKNLHFACITIAIDHDSVHKYIWIRNKYLRSYILPVKWKGRIQATICLIFCFFSSLILVYFYSKNLIFLISCTKLN